MRIVPFDQRKHGDFVLYSFERDFRRSRYGRTRLSVLGLGGVKSARSEFWDEARALISRLIDDAGNVVNVVVDSEDDAVVYGWMCARKGSDVLHYVVVKKDAAREGFAEDVLDLLIGDQVKRPTVCTLEIPGLGELIRFPAHWRLDSRQIVEVAA